MAIFRIVSSANVDVGKHSNLGNMACINVESGLISGVCVRTVLPMTAQQNVAFQELVSAWKQRDALRHAHAGLRELADARQMLDQARVEMALVR